MIISLGLGLVVGLILAVTGAGGGILAVPLLVFGAGLGVAEAGPVGLLAVGMAALLGTILGLKNGKVRYRAALLLAATGMLASPLGIWLARALDDRWLGILFGMVMLLVAQRTFRQPGADTPAISAAVHCVRDGVRGRFIWTRPCARALALAGALAGLLSGLLGIGGGFVLVPFLQRHTDLEMDAIVPTSLAVIALVSISGVVGSAASGGLNGAIALPFCLGGIAGMASGHLLARALDNHRMQKGFAILASAVGVGLIAKSAARFWPRLD